MSKIKISSTNWLAILLRNGTVGVFDLNDICSWQCLKTESIIKQTNDENKNNFHRYFIKFSPNGQILIFNGQNKQINVYKQCDFEKTEVWWSLKQIILLENSISSFELTNELIFIADINGNIYQIDLSDNQINKDLIIKAENSIIKNRSMILDMSFIHINENKLILIIADQNNHIRLNHYPNTSKIDRICHGHREFVSYIKLIDNNHLFSASGDGTIRLWKLPNCVPLVLLHSKTFILSSKQIFYTELYNSNNYHFVNDLLPYESSLDSSSIIDYSIWKMDVTCYYSNIYLAFSIYAYRSHSIYLTSLENMKQLTNEQCKLILDRSYGTIIDYCFLSNNYLENSNCYLYILFDSNMLIKIDILSILLCNQTELFAETNEIIQEINNILSQKEFHIIDCMNNYLGLDEIMFKEFFKNIKNSNENFSSQKRKTERNEQIQRKKQASSLEDDDDKNSLIEYF